MEEDLTTDLCVLQSHLDGMLERVEHNSQILKRLQYFEMKLLALNSLAEMVEYILGESMALLDLDIISLCLIDPNGEIAGYLESDNYDYRSKDSLFLVADDQLLKSSIGLPIRPFLGVYQAKNCSGFFPDSSEKPASVIIAPLMRRGKYLGSLNLGSFQTDRFTQAMATDFIQHIASVVSICFENTINFETLRLTILVDPLTGVNNRRYLEQRLEEELVRSQRSRQPLSCLFLDIDFFKRINDSYGHQAGDYVLALVAATIKHQLRTNDVLARYGGEEFVALLYQSDDKSCDEIAERIRASIATLKILYLETAIPVTISIGTATFRPNKAIDMHLAEVAVSLIKTADAALYEAKRNGRNRVESGGLVIDANCR